MIVSEPLRDNSTWPDFGSGRSDPTQHKKTDQSGTVSPKYLPELVEAVVVASFFDDELYLGVVWPKVVGYPDLAFQA